MSTSQASVAASRVIRSGNASLLSLIHRHLRPTSTTSIEIQNPNPYVLPRNELQPGTAALFNWHYLFPLTFSPRGESQLSLYEGENQAIQKFPHGNQFGLSAFLDDQSRVQARGRPIKIDEEEYGDIYHDGVDDNDDDEMDDLEISGSDFDDDDDDDDDDDVMED